MMVLRSGVDLFEIARLTRLAPDVRQRFIHRIFTEKENLLVGQSDASLAGRFAAKEAVAKALGCGIGPVAWHEIEIDRGAAQEPVLILHGNAQKIADDLGLQTWSISISHTDSHAVALAVAIGTAS
jgi:holo-[acyl-carrier protein] synthase